MNLLEHYIKEVHYVLDVTNRLAYPTSEPMYSVELTYDCYGSTGRMRKHFYKSEWEEAQVKGYFMA